ncbi:MAG: hypothetical protein AB7I19_04390 [Planctomycetota bacterium]
MKSSSKLAIVLGVVAAVLPLLSMQSPEERREVDAAADPFLQESNWSFTVLQYCNTKGDIVEIPARNIAKVWLLKDEDGDLRLEILFQNRDYSSVAVSDFSLIRSSPSAVAVDVPFVRRSIQGMQFPAMK